MGKLIRITKLIYKILGLLKRQLSDIEKEKIISSDVRKYKKDRIARTPHRDNP